VANRAIAHLAFNFAFWPKTFISLNNFIPKLIFYDFHQYSLKAANANHNSVANLATFVRLYAQKVTRLRSLLAGSC
jgi:hypothetical protein